MISRSKELGDGSKNFCNFKYKRLSGPLAEGGVFQRDSHYSVDSAKPPLSILNIEEGCSFLGCFDGVMKSSLSILDDNIGVTVNGIFNQVQKKQKLQDQMKKIQEDVKYEWRDEEEEA